MNEATGSNTQFTRERELGAPPVPRGLPVAFLVRPESAMFDETAIQMCADNVAASLTSKGYKMISRDLHEGIVDSRRCFHVILHCEEPVSTPAAPKRPEPKPIVPEPEPEPTVEEEIDPF